MTAHQFGDVVSIIRTVSEVIIAIAAIVAVPYIKRLLRMFQRRVKLLALLESKDQRIATIEQALENAKEGNDGLMIALQGMTAELKSLAGQVADLRRKLQVSLVYICEVVSANESGDHEMPPIPAELRADIEEGLKKGR